MSVKSERRAASASACPFYPRLRPLTPTHLGAIQRHADGLPREHDGPELLHVENEVQRGRILAVSLRGRRAVRDPVEIRQRAGRERRAHARGPHGLTVFFFT